MPHVPSRKLHGRSSVLPAVRPRAAFSCLHGRQRVGLGELAMVHDWRQIYGVSWLGGIGFTMSIFIANLAFPLAAHLDAAKLGTLGASLVASIGGLWLLRRST